MTRTRRVASAGVVVPAHNEEELLPACLAALREAAGSVRIPVRLLVVADACTDQTAAVAAARGAEVIRIGARNVGAARAAGLAALLRRTGGTDPAAVWLATTDADTVVPPGWLRRQLGYAAQGWDVVLGTVTVTDWTEHPPHCRPCSRRCTGSARDRTRTCTGRTSVSARRPTSPRAVSSRCRPPKTTPSCRRHRRRLPGPAGQRRHRGDLGPPPGAGPPRVQPPAAHPDPRARPRRRVLGGSRRCVNRPVRG